MTTLTLTTNARVRLHPFEDLKQCAAMTVDLLRTGTVGLSGGSTYAGLFPLWLRAGLDGTTASFFPVDERMVPFDHPQSNWGSAWRLFLKPSGLESQRSHAALSPRAYEHTLRTHFAPAEPVFDTIFLGVGDDGHTASLFPGSPALSDTTSLVLHTRSPKPPHDRITLGLRPLLCARHLVVIVAGQTKAPIMERIRRGDDSLPIVTVLAGRHESELYFEAGLGR